MPIIPEIPEIPIYHQGEWTGRSFLTGSGRSEDRLEESEGNGGVRKRIGRDFSEKRL